MAVIETWFKQDLKSMVAVHPLPGNVFTADNDGNLIGVVVFDAGVPADLAGSVSANIIRPDGGTVSVGGTLADGNRCSVILPQAAYAYPGPVAVIIKLTNGNTVTTIGAAVGTCTRSTTGVVVDPGTIIPSVQNLIDEIEAAIADVPASATNLRAALAETYSTSGKYAIGSYAWQEGKLYKCIVPITNGETWNSAHWTKAKLANDVSDLKSAIGDITDVQIIDGWVDGKAYKTTAGETITPWSPVNNAPCSCVCCECTAGDIFTLDIYNEFTSNYRPWCFIDADGEQVKKATNNTGRYENVEIEAPATATHLVVNASKTQAPHILYKGRLISKRVEMLENPQFDDYPTLGSENPVRSNGIYVKIQEVRDTIGYIETDVTTASEAGYYWDCTTDTAEKTAYETYRAYSPVTVAGGEEYKISIYAGSASRQLPVLFVDDDYKIIDHAGRRSGRIETLLVTVPNGATKILLTTPVGYRAKIYKRRLNDIEDERPWRGLYVSLLGDSISALKGYIPAGNDPYYGVSGDPSHSGITQPDEMWWGQLISALGGTPLIIDAWSGSCVTKGVRSADNDDDPQPEQRTAMSDVSRCNNLHAYVQAAEGDEGALLVVDADPVEGTSVLLSSIRTSPFLPAYTPQVGDYVKAIYPDIILSTGGVNDWTYMDESTDIGTYDGHRILNDIYGENAEVTTFREAYATMVLRMHSKYPSALVICCTGFFTCRPYQVKRAPNLNASSHLTMQDFSDAIKEIANLFGCPVVDTYINGFTRYNYYPTFAQDRDTSTTHPNKLGHKIIAENAAAKCKRVCPGYVAWLFEQRGTD